MPAAGIGALTDASGPSAWSTYFAVDDADATAERVADAGGEITTGPESVGDSGRLGFGSDCTGAVFGIWEAGTHFGAAVVNEHGGLNWNELITHDSESALGFYEQVFGHGRKDATTPGGRQYWMLTVESREIAGVIEPRTAGVSSHWTVYFAVDDVDRAGSTAEQEGGQVSFGPIDQPGVGRFVGLKDPIGAHLTVIELENEID